MKLLGIETSCDETAASIVEDGRVILSNVIASQIDIHAQYGGVVPEIAARSHIEAIGPVIASAFNQAGLKWSDIDGIAVTQGPGLLGSLMVGTLTARTLAITQDKPLYAVNHVVAHTFANFLINNEPKFPLLALSVSGGHTHLLLFNSPLEYRLLGATRDDAAGEAFDKVAKMMGLPYPGGPSIGISAESGDEFAYKLPRANLPESYDFSFSGLKTATLRSLQLAVGRDYKTPSTQIPQLLTEKIKHDMSASFQRTVCETLAIRLKQAFDEYQPNSVVIAGGVAANSKLKSEVTKRLPIDITYAPIELCTDNAAMIASMGYFLSKSGRTVNPYTLKADPNLAI